MKTIGDTSYDLGCKERLKSRHFGWQGRSPTWTAFRLVLLRADVALAGEAGTGLGQWLAPVAEECQPGTGRGPLPPETQQVAEGRRGAASGAAAVVACSERG